MYIFICNIQMSPTFVLCRVEVICNYQQGQAFELINKSTIKLINMQVPLIKNV